MQQKNKAKQSQSPAFGRRPDGDGQREVWMIDDPELVNRFSSFPASISRRAGSEKLFETSV